MRKNVFVLGLLIVATYLNCFNIPAEVDTELMGTPVIDYEKNVKYIGDKLWILYYDHSVSPLYTYLKLARETSNGGFEIIILDDFYVTEISVNKLQCTFAVSGTNVNIFYRRPDGTGEMVIRQVHSDDLLESWDITNSISMYQDIQNFSMESVEGDQYLVMLQNEGNGQAMIHDHYFEHSAGLEFDGDDEYFGSVYSKDDIYIRYANGGWPLFHEAVYTEGEIIDANTGQNAALSAPMDQIFQGGLEENINSDFSISAIDPYLQSIAFDLTDSSSRDLLYMKIDGTSSTCRYGDYITEADTLTVYNSFPSDSSSGIEIGDSIWTNVVEVPQVDWDHSTFNITLLNSSILIHCDTWIEGTISGDQTFLCTEDIYITDDILLSNTQAGNIPALGSHDYGCLYSYKNIYVKYKNYDPDTEQIQTSNCDGVYIYASLLASGDPVSSLPQYIHTAGGLKAEYLHPHGSTPGFDYVTPQNEVLSFIYPDLHKFVYYDIENFWGDAGFIMHSNAKPANYPSCGYPYEDPNYGDGTTPPYGADFPLYNPVYPESSEDITFYRGSIDLYGALYERRGYEVYCSGDEGEHHYNNIWDPENDLYGGTHAECGYQLNMHHDPRISLNGGFHFIINNLLVNEYELTILKFEDGDDYFYEDLNCFWNDISSLSWQNLLTDVYEDRLGILYSTNNGVRKHIFDTDSNYLQTLDSDEEFEGMLRSMKLSNETMYFCDDEMFYRWDFSLTDIVEIPEGEYNDFIFINDRDFFWKADWQYNDLDFEFFTLEGQNNPESAGSLQLENPEDIDNLNLNEMQLSINDDQQATLILHTKENWGDNLYYSRADLNEYTVSENTVTDTKLGLDIFPHPIVLGNGRSSINAMVTLAEEKPAVLSIYNLKGQIVSETEIFRSGFTEISLENPVSGLYLMRLREGKNLVYRKVLLLR